MVKHITDLPLEILVQITLTIDDIYTLEYWLACATFLEEVQTVSKHRRYLTIATTIKNYNYFPHQQLLKFKLTKITDEVERSRVRYYWRIIHNDYIYDMFMEYYGYIWLNLPIQEEESITLIYHSGANVTECHCGTVIKGAHKCIIKPKETARKVQVIKCCYQDMFNYKINNKCKVCRAHALERDFYDQWDIDMDGYARCSECGLKCELGVIPKNCECESSISTSDEDDE